MRLRMVNIMADRFKQGRQVYAYEDRQRTGYRQKDRWTVRRTCLQQSEQAPGGWTGIEADREGDRQIDKQTDGHRFTDRLYI